MQIERDMVVKYIPSVDTSDEQAIAVAMRGVNPVAIACNSWAVAFPYAPDVSFRMFHTGSELVVRYDVSECCTMARVTHDFGRIWTDSCVELFVALDDSGYYNFEITCIGRMLLSFRKVRPNPIDAPQPVVDTVRRYPSLGCEPFEERVGDNRWSLTAVIPATALFRHDVKSWSGLSVRMNLYKCGDDLSKPHFLSWQPIENPKPDFHLPQFFGEVRFE